MTSCRDPRSMPRTDRIAEIAAILAIGYRRLVLRTKKEPEHPEKRLAEVAEDEAPCHALNRIPQPECA